MIGRLKFNLLAGALMLTSGALVAGAPVKPLKSRPQVDRPNVVIILADDLGFSDIGAFGGEIATPNLDQLAHAGLRLTDFHASPTCSPTRSMLLSGTDNHTAGVGAMAESGRADGRWGYEGHLTTRVATLAERMRGADYTTLMAGKWHLGLDPDQDPHARGFEHSFALLQGAHNHFGKGGFGPDDHPGTAAWYSEDGVRTGIPAQFYSSDYFTSKLIGQIDAAPKDKPFFAYLAFTAPHSPLQAPAELIAKYKGRYDGGWDQLRQQRLKRMKKLGLVDDNVAPAPLSPDARAWGKLDAAQRQVEARKMEIYAAMVERMDENIGRLVQHLRATGQYSNTIFIFSSDNGAAGEVPQTFSVMPGELEYIARADNRLDNLGSASSFVMYGPYWAQAAMAPSRMHKGWMTEGGTRVPAIVSYAGFKRQGRIGTAYGNVMDIAPTILEAAGGHATLSVDKREVAPVRGRSMLPYLLDRSPAIHGEGDAVAMELHGQRSVRQGRWKLLRLSPPFGDGVWALYDLKDDPAEQKNVAAEHPEQVRTMQAAWDQYAAEARIAAP
jgi:arylsulfatase